MLAVSANNNCMEEMVQVTVYGGTHQVPTVEGQTDLQGKLEVYLPHACRGTADQLIDKSMG